MSVSPSGRSGPQAPQGLDPGADPAGSLRRGVAGDRVLAGPALVGGQGERVDVGGRAGELPIGLLGRHVGERSDHLAGGGQRRRPRDPGDPEVHQLRPSSRAAVVADDHVLGLDVTVDDPAGVGVGERLAEVEGDLGDVAVVEHPGGAELVERLAGDQLGDQDRAAGVLTELVEGDDRRVVETGGGLCLAQDAVGVGGGELLQRNLAFEPLVVGPVDGSHAPGADLLEHPEALHHQLLHHDPDPSPDRGRLLPPARPGVPPRQGSYSDRRKASAPPWLSSTRTN